MIQAASMNVHREMRNEEKEMLGSCRVEERGNRNLVSSIKPSAEAKKAQNAQC